MRSLSLKLTLAVLAVGLTGAVLVALFAGRMTTIAMRRFAQEQTRGNFIADVSAYYQERGSWEGVWDMLRRKTQPGLPPPRPENGRPALPRPPPQRPPEHALVDRNGVVVVPAPPYRPGQRLRAEQIQGIDIVIEGEVVGTVLTNAQNTAPTSTEGLYLSQIYAGLGVGTVGATIAALLLGVLIVRTLTRPLKELTEATQAVARGDLTQKVPVRSKDELGELAISFNQMSADLARANHLRQQMTADIAHDLRTPLTVLAGYIESLHEGVLQPSATMFGVLHDEVQHLQRLIEDLRTLSLADANELPLNQQRVFPQTLLKRLAMTYMNQALQHHIALHVEADPALPEIWVDPERMAQVIGNLISNALRYTPDGREIRLAAFQQGGEILLKVQDNGSGIAPEKLPFIFDRFYRADEARQQQESESGLGLAIAKSLVEAHGGTISVVSTVGEGTTFSIALSVA
jgi:signal transduction histidine kinase